MLSGRSAADTCQLALAYCQQQPATSCFFPPAASSQQWRWSLFVARGMSCHLCYLRCVTASCKPSGGWLAGVLGTVSCAARHVEGLSQPRWHPAGPRGVWKSEGCPRGRCAQPQGPQKAPRGQEPSIASTVVKFIGDYVGCSLGPGGVSGEVLALGAFLVRLGAWGCLWWGLGPGGASGEVWGAMQTALAQAASTAAKLLSAVVAIFCGFLSRIIR